MENHGKAMEEVVRGIEFSNQLRQVLVNNNELTSTSLAQNLVNNVINSFNNTMFLLNKDKYFPTNQIQKDSSSINPVIRSIIDFKESCNGTTSTTMRGYCKRRKTTQTLEKVTKTPTDDGHQWRKYGQKKIRNSQYFRTYYRCTHKYDQRCQTTKQVHRIQENPPLYKTTYYGHHTCGNFPNPNIILDPNDTSSLLLSFNNTFPTPTKHECPFLSSSSSSSPPLSSSHSVEYKEEVPSSSLDISNPLSANPTLDTYIPTLESDHTDWMYGFLYDSVEYDGDFFHTFH